MVDGQFFGPDGVPTFTTSFNVQNNTIVREFQIKNVKFSNLPNTALKDLPRNRLPKDLNAELKITKIREQQVAVLTLHPLLNQNGQARKLVSFTLEYSLGSPQETATANRFQNQRFTSSSVLAQGTWYKFRVDTTGVFRIGREQLQEIGVSTSGLDPADIRIFGNGGRMLPQANSTERTDDLRENALFVYGGEDGSFDEGDYVLFYAIGPHGWDIDKESFRLSQHETNIYSDHAYYFLTVDNGKGQRIAVATPPDTPADASINTYQDFLVHESESINLFANGQQWMGEDFSFEDNQAFDFDISDLDNSQDITIRMRGAAVSFSDTRMRATINGQEALLLQFNALSNNSFALATTDVDSREVAVDRDQVRVEVSFENGGNPSSRGYLDYIELIATRKLIARGKQFSFRNVNASNTALLYEYRIQNASDPDQVWDVSDPYQPRILQDADSGNDYVFRAFGGIDKEFVLVDPDDLYQVEAVNDNRLDNQNLHGFKDVDYLIISPAYLMTEAERLADHHRQRSGWNVQVVDLEAVYNEFASGSPDLISIRDFVRFLYQTASSPAKKIRYLCLFGDSSFDFKDRITDNNNVVPAFQSYESFNLVTSFVTDDYFGMMDESEGELGSDDMQDVATGRFPVTSLTEAREAVDKTLQYYDTSSLGDWRNTVTFVADDPDTPNEFVLQETVDQIARELEAEKPSFNLKKIYADAYQQESSAGGERYPSVNEAIDNAVETGSLVLDYFGHGGVNGWANERILEVPQIQKWNNFNTLPLFITVTCEFARFDNPIRPTAGEYTFLNSKGGAVNMIATSREIFIGVGQVFNNTLMQNLFGFDQSPNTISEALMRTKNEFRSVQRLFVYNFGDPAMRLAQAGPDIRITKINEKDVQQSRDTLKALSRMRLEGVVMDGGGQIATDFNGTLTATIYDKPLDKTTLDNDNFGRTMPFTAIESKIFRGRASVNNGAFSVDFIVPKDIRIAYGKAKISLYAENQEVDRTGADLSVTIGGIDPNAPTDTERSLTGATPANLRFFMLCWRTPRGSTLPSRLWITTSLPFWTMTMPIPMC